MDVHRRRPLCRICLMALALVLLFLLSFVWGRYDVPLGQVKYSSRAWTTTE